MVKNGLKQDDIPEIIVMISCANYMATLADGLMVVPDEHFYEVFESAKKSAAT